MLTAARGAGTMIRGILGSGLKFRLLVIPVAAIMMIAGIVQLRWTPVDVVSSTSGVMVIGLSSKDMSLIDMSVLGRWLVKSRLMGISGVANVSVWGQRERQLQVQVDPKQLAASGVTLDQVLQTTGKAM